MNDAAPPTRPPRPRPEVLAPAGNMDALRAALAAGADAVYFGLDDGFNARARAKNFATGDLDAIVRACHRAGARAYLTLNTLIFERELPLIEAILRRVGASGVDALIVQDPAVALLAQRVCPELELHASTQMTVSSPEAARFAAKLGVSRIVLPRELSVEQIRLFREGSALELEVFIHGALCMSWSGQCLTSEAWGGRSANRGQCAQSCRLPYGLIVDGQPRDLGERRYLLSPSDLAGYEAIGELVEIGVDTLKIEGRLKGPAYITTSVEGLRRWLDAVMSGQDDTPAAQGALASDLAEMHRVFSRGFTSGFLLGTDHQRLVDGRHPKHRGRFLGRVLSVGQGPEGPEVIVRETAEFPVIGQPGVPAEAPLSPKRGMGVVFDLGDPEDPDEPGGALFAVTQRPDKSWALGFARDQRLAPELSRVTPGARAWINSDPAAESRAQRALKAPEPRGRIGARLRVWGALGEPLGATLSAMGHAATGLSALPLAAATGAGLDGALIRAKLGGLGGSLFRLDELDLDALPEGLFVSPGALKRLRRALVAELEAKIEAGQRRTIDPAPALPPVSEALRARAEARLRGAAPPPTEPTLVPLCRQDAQLDAALALGFEEVELDWMEMVGLGRAVARAHAAGAKVTIATPRIQKPGEEQLDARIARLAPEGILVRHLGGLMWLSDGHGSALERPPLVHGDFSLNVTNSLTFWHLIGLGLDTVTASHDLDERQLLSLVDAIDPARLTVVAHHHIPTFHTEHCVYAASLSEGANSKSCGRPCDHHALSLRDPKGLPHPVIVDLFCRNTVFEARAQSAATLVPRLLERGVRRFRVELVRESAEETTTVLRAYRELLAARLSPRQVTGLIGAHEQFGVVRGVATSALDRR